MNQEQFETSLKELFTDVVNKEELSTLVKTAVHNAYESAGGVWNNKVAAERFKQWEWFHSEMIKPKTHGLPESTLHRLYKDYLKERGYTANKLIEKSDKMTPDFLIKGSSLELLNEFKAPELIFNEELRVYKFQTTHSKILTLVYKAVKQLQTEDSSHHKPWIVTFASTHFQLNWTSFIQTLQGGVAFDDKLSPDFTNTDMFKRVITKAKKIDLYIWLQVNPANESIYQVSLIINKNSSFIDEVKKIVSDLKAKDVSSMDNIYSLDWPA